MPKFIKGDRVELVNIIDVAGGGLFNSNSSNTIGNLGVVSNDNNGYDMIAVKWDNGSSNSYFASNLKLLPSDEDSQPRKTFKDE